MNKNATWLCGCLLLQAPLVLGLHALVLASAARPLVMALAFMLGQLLLTGWAGRSAGWGWETPLPYLVPLGVPLMLVLPASWPAMLITGAAYYLDLAACALFAKAR